MRKLLAAAVVGAVFLSAGTASASHTDSMFPTGRTGWKNCNDYNVVFCQTDSATLTVFRLSSVQSAMRDATALTLNNSYHAGTDLNVVYSAAPSYDGAAETDIIYRGLTSLPEGTWGQAFCNDPVSTTRCDQHYVDYNNTMLGRSSTTTTIRRSVACHETGHAVGLTHGENANPEVSNSDYLIGCMSTGGRVYPTYLREHNVGQINATY